MSKLRKVNKIIRSRYLILIVNQLISRDMGFHLMITISRIKSNIGFVQLTVMTTNGFL